MAPRARHPDHYGCRDVSFRHGPTGLGIEWEEFASETLIQTVRIATSIHPFPIGPRPLPELSNCTIYGASHGRVTLDEIMRTDQDIALDSEDKLHSVPGAR